MNIPLLGNHQKCWIWGRHAVLETLKAGFWRPYEVMLADLLPQSYVHIVEKACAGQNIPITRGTNTQLEKLCRHEDHQGMIAKMPPFPYTSLDIFDRLRNKHGVFVYLDGIQDPFNLGAIIRSADVLGVNGILIPAEGQVGVTNMVVKSSAGAVNAVPVVRMASPINQLADLQKQGYRMYGMAAHGAKELDEVRFSSKSIIILGNEAEGIRTELMDLCNERVRISVKGIVDSLNVAVTAGIVMYAATRT